MSTPQFRPDLYRGTAQYYEQFRPAYPAALIADLAARTGLAADGRLLDLACGTGQLSFALCRWSSEVCAVDAEPDMISVARQKAAAAGLDGVRFEVCRAEDVPAQAGSLDLVVIGNAFHRLRRTAVAASALRWLRPGKFLALVWGGSPYGEHGTARWQQVLAETVRRWTSRPELGGRVPAEYAEDRREHPDLEILQEAGFRLAGLAGVRCQPGLDDPVAGRRPALDLGAVERGTRRAGDRVRCRAQP